MSRETLGEDRYGSGDPWIGLGRVGGPQEVRNGSGDPGEVRDGSVELERGLCWVGRPTERFGMSRQTLGENRDGLGDPQGGSGRVEGPSGRSRMG